MYAGLEHPHHWQVFEFMVSPVLQTTYCTVSRYVLCEPKIHPYLNNSVVVTVSTKKRDTDVVDRGMFKCSHDLHVKRSTE
jgi:hypothetical protein